MLSNPLHRFPSYQGFPVANMLPNGHLPSNHMHGSGLDNLGHGGQYALQQLQRHIDIHQSSQGSRTSNTKHRQHPYNISGGAGGRVSGANGNSSGPVRRRISRACDQCNQLRTKCDGQNPCAHCVGMELVLELYFLSIYADFVQNSIWAASTFVSGRSVERHHGRIWHNKQRRRRLLLRPTGRSLLMSNLQTVAHLQTPGKTMDLQSALQRTRKFEPASPGQ
jgi:hypothetical protein